MAFNPMMAGIGAGTGGMVKALMDGNSQYGDEQKKQQMLQQMIAAKAQAPQAQGIGGMVPPVNPQGMPGAAPMMRPPMMSPQQPFPQAGAPPMNIDPMTQALFSPIPGVGGR